MATLSIILRNTYTMTPFFSSLIPTLITKSLSARTTTRIFPEILNRFCAFASGAIAMSGTSVDRVLEFSKKFVFYSMARASVKFQVIKRIVQAVAVFVMDNFRRLQFSLEELCHDQPMF